MLTFLRKIRRSFIESGATSKYLLYAVGEIALVVIGILIALSINNWNDQRITAKKENDLLRILSHEMANTYDYLNSEIENSDAIISRNGMKLLEYTKSPKKEVNIDSFSNHLMEVFYIGGFAPQTAKFQQVISGDGMDLIRFDSLQLLLIQYKNQLDLAYNHDLDIGDQKEIEEFWNKNLIAHTIVKQGAHNWFDLFEDDDPSSFKIDINGVISNPEFENIVVNRLMLLYSAKKRLIRVQRHIIKLLNFIEHHYKL